MATAHAERLPFWNSLASRTSALARDYAPVTGRLAFQIAGVFLAYLIAGKLGQATTSIRSSNLGPVWPAYGIALAAFLACGYRVWPGIAASAFVVAFSSAVPPLAAAGQAVGATVGALTGAFLLRRIPHFDPSLSRLRDALGFIVLGAFGSAILSASIGMLSLYVTRVQAYSGLGSAWLIYWLGDSTGVLLVTPLVFTLPHLLRTRSRVELATLLTLLTAACFVIFGDLPFLPVRLHVLAYAVLPFVMWAAISFGIAGSSLSVFLIATIATLSTAFGLGPFAGNTSFINAVLLDVLFAVLAVSGLAVGALIAERERGETARAVLIREQAAMEGRLRLAAIVDSSHDAIFSKSLDGVILSWNAAAHRTYGYTADEIIGRPAAMLVPPERESEEQGLLEREAAGERVERFETIRLTKAGRAIDVTLTTTPLTDTAGTLIGTAEIARDITEQRRAQSALSGLSRRLLLAQEEERARIARELHDDIGQRLALMAIGLHDLSGDPATAPLPSQKARLLVQVSELATDLQALSHELHSSKLELLGVETAMRGFCNEFADQQNITVDLSTENVPIGLPPDTALCLFRVLQEALRNGVKHSGARHFQVRLWGAHDEVHLEVSDRGSGFDLESARAGQGLGLLSMKERLELVNGELSIDTEPSRGTIVHARTPLRSDNPKPDIPDRQYSAKTSS